MTHSITARSIGTAEKHVMKRQPTYREEKFVEHAVNAYRRAQQAEFSDALSYAILSE